MNKLAQEQIGIINSAISKMRGTYKKWAKKHNINYHELLIIYELRMYDTKTQRQIRGEHSIPKQTINNIITNMIKQGHIKLIAEGEDKRKKKIVFTEEGEKYADEILKPLLKIEEQVVREMGKENMKMLVKMVSLYGNLLEKNV